MVLEQWNYGTPDANGTTWARRCLNRPHFFAFPVVQGSKPSGFEALLFHGFLLRKLVQFEVSAEENWNKQNINEPLCPAETLDFPRSVTAFSVVFLRVLCIAIASTAQAVATNRTPGCYFPRWNSRLSQSVRWARSPRIRGLKTTLAWCNLLTAPRRTLPRPEPFVVDLT